MYRLSSTRLDRAELARALEHAANWDVRLAGALATCEAWEAGYISGLLNHAATIAAADDKCYESEHERAIDAVQRAIFIANPRSHAARADMAPSSEAIDSLFALLASMAEFHECTTALERRQWYRTPPPSSGYHVA